MPPKEQENLQEFKNLKQDANKNKESRERHNCYDTATTALANLQKYIKRKNRHGNICTPQPGGIDDLSLTENETISRIISDGFKEINQDKAQQVIENGGKVMVLYISTSANDYHVIAVDKTHTLNKAGTDPAEIENKGFKDIVAEDGIMVGNNYYVRSESFFIREKNRNLKKDVTCSTTMVK